MPKADFHLLSSGDIAQRDFYLCRLCEKIYRLGHRIYILCKDSKELEHLDDLLYYFRPESFIPHSIEPESPSSDTPVFLCTRLPETISTEVVINLTEAPPDKADRVVELVTGDPDARAKSRKVYKLYKQLGFELQTYNIESA
ncbi:DNA polymerase III subunit chi [Hahella sp. HN01]|uniref:DNA polymerase III subunit chi n=1 Tax=Hahella sp. HN01 TaxID=2847262 RepID=UPI001C1E9218|nr:DNA polymerase III subunit chi [Hahella sp. HN01]MBU6953480.1 DNA polymerase III subunit chi [Hahella sp. HN01]